MEVQTRHTPTFGVARVLLSAGEAVQADSGAKVACSFGMGESRQGRGARGRGPIVFTAPSDGGWVDLAPRHPGDVYALSFDGRIGWSVARNSVLAQPSTIRADATWPPLQSLFGADSGFLEHYSGHGQLVLASAGPVDALTLERGEIITVTPGFLVAYPDSVQCRLRAVDPAGPQSVRTGEGLEVDFAGPGTVLVQARRH